MGRRVPGWAGFVAAPVVVFLAICSYYAHTRHYRTVSGNPAGSPSDSAVLQQSTDPEALLGIADHFYWLNNGPAAAPLYARAEKLFSERSDARNQLHAKVGRLRSEAETMSFVDLSRFLNEQLQNPIVQGDKRLRLWCLIAKGYTDIEIDYRATKRDWLEAQEIANLLGDKQWATRASGELGLVAFLEGNPGRAARLLGGALLSTMASGDTGGQIRFLELIGRGFEEVNRHTEALRFFERAIKLADAEKDSGLPFMAYEGKAQALVALGKPQEAKAVLDDALGKARSQDKRGHEAELLILLGRLASQTGDRKQAIADLESAAQFSKRVQFFRMEADAMFELATLYRDAGDLPTAEARATDGLDASQRVGDRYYVPRNLTILADLKARRGRVIEPLLAVGDVAYENQGGSGRRIPPPASIRGRIERGIADLSGIGLHDLPETRAEVEEIGKIVGSDAVILLGKDATETGFKKQPLDQFRILHLAVHGFADTQYPERSALVLGADSQSADDGLLQVREIIRLRLNAELTTLSACDSGVGKLQGQEGISNLVEAFLVAGSKSVVASLWSADDTFASALMEQFYRHLAQGEDTSSALRNAKLDLLAKYGDQVSPFYWAAFIAVGETSTPIGIKQQ